MGSLPGRISRSSTVTTPVPGMINGPSYYCTTTTCPEGNMNGFLFNRDYRIDTILWRDLYQGVTNAMYAKPTIRYEVTTGLSLFVSGVYSRAMFVEGTPSAACGTATGLSGYDPSTGKCVAGQSLVGDANLGVELNGGANYVSDDGFVLGITYAVLFPLGGLNNNYTNPTQGASTAQAVRGMIGVKF
jgi:uncharacterized protein (TIGR04551 family)